MVASSGGARTAPRFLRLRKPTAENAGNHRQGDQRVLLREKDVLTGMTGGVSSQCRLILPLICGKGARQIGPPHPSHPIMRRPGADLEEKREPRVTGKPTRSTR